MSFSSRFAGGLPWIDLYPLCCASQKSLSPLCDWCLSFYHRSENCNLLSLQGRGFNIVERHVQKKKNNGTLSALSGSPPHLPLCQSPLSARPWKDREKGILICWQIRANKDTGQHTIAPVLTPQGPESSKVSDLHLCEITPQNKKKKKKQKERKSGYRSNACSNKLVRRRAQHTIKNNVA